MTYYKASPKIEKIIGSLISGNLQDKLKILLCIFLNQEKLYRLIKTFVLILKKIAIISFLLYF